MNLLFLVVFSVLFASSMPEVSGRYGQPIFNECLMPFVKKETAFVKEELVQTSQKLEEERKKAADLDEQTFLAKQKVEAIGQKIAARNNSDELTYARLGQIADRGKLPDTLAAYEGFVKDRPGSPYVACAQQQIELIKSEIAHASAQHEQTLAEAARTAALAESILKEKLAKNQLTLSEMRNALLGKSRDEVTTILGPPTEIAPDAYLYDKVLVLESASGRQRPFAVIFLEGNVKTVNYADGK